MSEVVHNTTSNLESILQCPICLEMFGDPHALTCGHVFCLGCIRRIVRCVRDRRLVFCPTCKRSCNFEQLVKMFVLQDVIDTQKSLANCNTPVEYCQTCERSFKIDDMWACRECELKAVCSKCMVTNHDECDQSPCLLAELLREKKEKMEEWNGSVKERNMGALDIAVRQFDRRLQQAKQRVSSLRDLLRGHLLTENGDEMLARFTGDYSNMQTECTRLVNLTCNGALGIRLATCDDQAKWMENRMRDTLASVQLQTWKFEQFTQVVQEFVNGVRSILDSDTGTNIVNLQQHAIRQETAEEVVSDFAIPPVRSPVAAGATSANNSTTNTSLIMLNDEETEENQ